MSIHMLFTSIKLEIKSIGVTCIAPLLAGLFTIMFAFAFYMNGLRNTMYVIPPIEMILPVFASWYAIYFMSLVFDDEICEVVFSFPNSIWKQVFTRIFFIFIFYSMYIASIVIISQLICGVHLFPSLIIQICSQSLFYISLGTLSMCFFSNVNYSLSVVAIYFCVQVLTKGRIMPTINIYLFNNTIIETNIIFMWSMKPLFISLALFSISYIISKNKFQRANIFSLFHKINKQ